MNVARKASPRGHNLRWVSAVAVVTLAYPSMAQAFDLSVYGHGGYDMVSSSPGEGAEPNVASPEPTGPSFGLGVASEFVRFADKFGLGANLGFGSASASWQADKTGMTPSGVTLALMGVEVGGRATFHIGAVRLFGYGDFLYGLFGNEYTNSSDGTTSNPSGTVNEFDVDSAFRASFGAGVGYTIGAFSIDLRGGMASVSLTVLPQVPASSTAADKKTVTDTYVGFTGGAVVSYRFLGGAAAPDPSERDGAARDGQQQKPRRDPTLESSSETKKKAPPGKKPKKKRKKRPPAASP